MSSLVVLQAQVQKYKRQQAAAGAAAAAAKQQQQQPGDGSPTLHATKTFGRERKGSGLSPLTRGFRGVLWHLTDQLQWEVGGMGLGS